jgi:hypothetical protein
MKAEGHYVYFTYHALIGPQDEVPAFPRQRKHSFLGNVIGFLNYITDRIKRLFMERKRLLQRLVNT